MTTVLALVTDAFGGRGGIAQYNRDFLNALAFQSTHRSVVVLPRHAPDLVMPPERIDQKRQYPGRIGYAINAVRVALSQPIEIVLCGHLYMAPLAWLLARLKGAKLVFLVHGIEAWQHPSSLRCFATENADLILCVSRYTRARVASWARTMPERILVVPNTVGDSFIPGDGARLRRELQLTNKKVLLTVARLEAREQYKGHDRIITALPRLVAEGHNIIYLVVGEGDDRRRLEELSRTLGVSERVVFLGRVEPARLTELYCSADLFVMPSTGEGFGIAFLEAMATGTPALGLAVGGAVDALGDGELGLAVAESQLATSIARVLADPKPNPEELSHRVRMRFGWTAFCSRVGCALSRLEQ